MLFQRDENEHSLKGGKGEWKLISNKLFASSSSPPMLSSHNASLSIFSIRNYLMPHIARIYGLFPSNVTIKSNTFFYYRKTHCTSIGITIIAWHGDPSGFYYLPSIHNTPAPLSLSTISTHSRSYPLITDSLDLLSILSWMGNMDILERSNNHSCFLLFHTAILDIYVCLLFFPLASSVVNVCACVWYLYVSVCCYSLLTFVKNIYGQTDGRATVLCML